MMRRAVLVCLLGALVACSPSGPSVTVNDQALIGAYVPDSDIVAFKGVPFAAPPVGALRWRAPQPYAPTARRRDALEFAPACMQSPRILDWYRDVAETFGASRDVFADLDVSEDCLYLNIWTPSLDPDAALPVMVYLHGGSNNSGWSFEPNYHGHALAEQDVVVVTIAYRLGGFGFLSHPDFATQAAQANFGLHDQIAALDWLQQHIGRFGGDADNITLFGESAGAENVLALMFIDDDAARFQNAILQSTAGFGLPGNPTLADETARGVALAGDADTIETLRALAATELLDRYETMVDASGGHYHSPAVGGPLLSDSVWTRLLAGDIPPHNLIIGTNGNEWYEDVGPVDTPIDLVRIAASLTYVDAELGLQVVGGETDLRYAADRLLTADSMLCPSTTVAEAFSAAGNNVWVYHFTREREGPGGDILRAYHGAELPYVFDTHDTWMPTTSIDRHLTAAITGYWSNLARVGDPNGTGALPAWPQYAAPGFNVMTFGDRLGASAHPEPALCASFAEQFRED